jgi:hypothetical protein
MSKQEEGELKKRILLIAGKGSLMPLLSPQDVANKIGDILGEVFEILDEAKQDFYLLELELYKQSAEWLSKDITVAAAFDRSGDTVREKRIKWFGTLNGSRISKPSSAGEHQQS